MKEFETVCLILKIFHRAAVIADGGGKMKKNQKKTISAVVFNGNGIRLPDMS